MRPTWAPPERTDAAILAELRERFDLAMEGWREIRAEAAEDMRYVAGDPWDADAREARDKAGRPCLSLDELGQYVNQLVNEVRANPRSVQFSPTGAGANDAAARFYQDKTREIEYRSAGQIAFTTAFENAVQRSYGWCRVNTRFSSPRSFDQEIWIEDVPNPDHVIPDPEAKRPDGSDLRYLFHYEIWQQKDFVQAFPKARVHDFGEYLTTGQLKSWVQAATLTLAEYWVVETHPRRLLLLADPAGGPPRAVFEDELGGRVPPGVPVLKDRSVDWPTVRQYLTNGVEILKRSTWAGKYIPFASCLGKVIYVDDGSGPERRILSLVRLARDPFMAYCYTQTCILEALGGVPRASWVGYEGQFRGHETTWQKANHEPVAYLEAKGTTPETGANNLLPLPQKQAWDPPVQNLAVVAETYRRAIQAAMGTSPLPTDAQRRNEKSGIALRRIEESAQRGSYHFIDHYDDMIRHVGVIIEDLMDKIYDTPRDVGIRKADGTAGMVRINDPAATQGPNGEPQEPVSTAGEYIATISTGPSYESERMAASEFADQLAQNPQIFPLIGPLVVKLKNLGPIGDQIAEALEVLQPPELRQAKDGKPDPAQLMKQLADAQQLVQQLSQELTARVEQIQTEQVKAQAALEEAMLRETSETERAKLKAESDERQAALDNLVKLAIAEINATKDAMNQHAEMARAELGYAHEHAEAERSRAATAAEGDADRAFQAEQSAAAEASRAMLAGDGGPGA